MSIIYSISMIALFISGLLLKKSEKKLDLITWIIVDIVLLFCYNTVVCYVYSTFNHGRVCHFHRPKLATTHENETLNNSIVGYRRINVY